MTAKLVPPARMVELGREESLALLAGAVLGRVAFSRRALPAIRPVNHVVDDGHVVIRSHSGSGLLGSAGTGDVVAYEADEIDTATRTGWSVVITGMATEVREAERVARYHRMLTPWIDAEMNRIVQIHIDIVHGYRLVAAGPPAPRAPAAPAAPTAGVSRSG